MQNMRFLLFFIWKNQIHWEIKIIACLCGSCYDNQTVRP